MRKINDFLQKIPALLASQISIFIFIFLFVYLFIFGLLGLVIKTLEPSSNTQLVFGNYTNVLSALGAALAAGSSSRHTKTLKELHKRHDNLQASLNELHAKVDELNK